VGATISEKILARCAGRPAVRAGDEVEARPDFVLAYELRGYTDAFARDMALEFGVSKVPEPKRFAIFIDHRVPAKTPEDEALHVETRRWSGEQGVALFDRQGIGHQVAAEAGYAVPGAFVVHFDAHISQLGAFGTLAMGVRSNLLEAFVRERISLRVPESVLVRLSGNLQPGVMARDVFHHLIARFGSEFCNFKVLELAGPGLASLSMEGLQTITCLSMFTGAVSAIVNPSAEAIAYAASRARATIAPVFSDPDAQYHSILDVPLGDVEPMVAAPPSPANVHRLAEYSGLAVQAGYLGSCASGRLEDLRAAAAVLKGRQVAAGFSLHVIPTSREIMSRASHEGLLQTFIDAGAFVSSSSCDYCSGNIATIAAGQRAVSTGTLNVPGRMGSPDAEIYLCNAAVLAASAVAGRITDPRRMV
jgi:3-isopropylmalate/(R)-2-methylmalate dehydratase large subunit